jgi:hypothetical protein
MGEGCSWWGRLWSMTTKLSRHFFHKMSGSEYPRAWELSLIQSGSQFLERWWRPLGFLFLILWMRL